MDVRTEKGRLEAQYVRWFSFSNSAIIQLAPEAAANDLILIKKAHQFFIHPGISSETRYTHRDAAHLHTPSSHCANGSEGIGRMLMSLSLMKALLRQPNNIRHLVHDSNINWNINVSCRVVFWSSVLELPCWSETNFPCSINKGTQPWNNLSYSTYMYSCNMTSLREWYDDEFLACYNRYILLFPVTSLFLGARGRLGAEKKS